MHFEYLRAFISLSSDQLSLSGKFPLPNSSRKALGCMSLPGEKLETLIGTCLFSGSSHSLYTPPATFHGLLFYLPRLLVTTI